MIRILGATAVTLIVTLGGSDRGAERAALDVASPPDIGALLTAARGAPPLICAMASHNLPGYNWGSWNDAPVTPLSSDAVRTFRDNDTRRLPDTDVALLMDGLGSSDACVREISVRFLGAQETAKVNDALASRLTSADASMRELAAFGLGLAEAKSSVDALIRSLRDATAGVRANAAWALGRMESGKALSSVIPLFNDHKLLTQVAGHGNHTIKLLPTLTISDEDCVWIERSFDSVITAAHRSTGAVWKLGKTLVGNAVRARTAARA